MLIVSGFVAFGRPFIRFYVGDTYEDAYWVAILMMIPNMIPLVQSICLNVVVAQNKHKFRSLVYLGIAILNVVGTWFLMRYMGIIGAALMTGVALIIGQGFVMNWYYHKKTGLDMLRFWKQMLSVYIVPTLLCITDSNLNHTGIYLYSKGKIMIHLTFDYKTDEKCTTPGQYLKYHRTFQGLSTRELAEKVGIVPATLVLYENDRHPIKHSTAVALANALGIDRNRLLDKYTAFVDNPYSSLLKKVRQDLSLTQIQMAELIGIGQTSYSGWEREIRVPRRKEYDKILAALEKLRVNVDTYLCQSASI